MSKIVWILLWNGWMLLRIRILEQPAIKNLEIEKLCKDHVIDPVPPPADLLRMGRKLRFVEFALDGGDEPEAEAEKEDHQEFNQNRNILTYPKYFTKGIPLYVL